MAEIDPRFLIIEPLVPKANNPGAVKIRKILKTGTEYSEVDSIRIDGTIPMDCFTNVDKATQKGGGNIVYGWQIWETLPGVMMEAEFHAAWKDASGVMHDVTPHMFDGIEHILFLPDPNRTYSGKQVDNLRIALVKDKMVEQFIKNAKHRFKALNAGDLAYRHGAIAATPEMQQIDRKFQQLESQIKQKYFIKARQV